MKRMEERKREGGRSPPPQAKSPEKSHCQIEAKSKQRLV